MQALSPPFPIQMVWVQAQGEGPWCVIVPGSDVAGLWNTLQVLPIWSVRGSEI